MEKISVIIPTYNREKTIMRSVNSVLNQTYLDIEVIVVDDCSTDNTTDILKKIKDERVKVIKLNKNSGANYARNIGIENATGDYIAFQDSDDEWICNKLELQLANLKRCDSDIDFCAIRVNCDKNVEIIPNDFSKKNIEKYGYSKALMYNNFISTQAILAKKECFEKNKFDNSLPRLQDYDLVLRLSQIYVISHTNNILVDLFVQNDSISKSNIKLKNAVDIMTKRKYYSENKYNKVLYNTLYKFIYFSFFEENKSISKDYGIKSLKLKFNFKIFIKCILIKIGLIK